MLFLLFHPSALESTQHLFVLRLYAGLSMKRASIFMERLNDRNFSGFSSSAHFARLNLELKKGEKWIKIKKRLRD
jgi:hypothetical protein